MSNFQVKSRCEVLGSYIADHRATVREAAKYYGVSKSTVHKDVTADLKKMNPELYKRVREVLLVNKMERHLRGGEATRRKYKAQSEKRNAKKFG